ncbi:MAG: hypothetical protein L6R41_004411 [Letrouitia leprolyta]|nr:MAG: hypothetical protein L6R41_004411 [Letrouitia leprolyta]
MNLRNMSNGQYFSWVYLPSALAIVAAIMWGIIDDEIKRIEPFLRAFRLGGANAGIAGEDGYKTASISINDMLGNENSKVAFNEGVIRPVLYLSPSWSRAQETLLLLITVLGALFTYRLFIRQSGMTASYGNLASLSAIAMADSSFLKLLSNSMDLNERRASIWRTRLENATVHLGDFPCQPDLTPGSCSTTHDCRQVAYGLRFGSFTIPDFPSSTKDRNLSSKRILHWIPRLCFFLFLICIILSIFNGVNEYKSSGGKNVTEAQNSLSPTVVLIISAITKTLWKTMEQRIVALVPFYHRFSLSMKNELSAFPSLGRDYSRMPPGCLTIFAFRDKQYTLAFVSLMSIALEVANFLLAVATSMSQGSGWNAGALLRVSGTAAVLFTILLLFCGLSSTRLASKYTPLLDTPSTIANQLAYISRSDSFLNDMLPLNVITDQKERMVYLKGLQGSYCFGRVKASDLTGGFMYGIEKSDALLPSSSDGSSQPKFAETYSTRRMRKSYSERRREQPSNAEQQTMELC